MNMKFSKYFLLGTIILGTINVPNVSWSIKKVNAEELLVQNNVQTQSGVTIDKSNFDKYFTINGSANYDKQSGELILTPDSVWQAGSATSKTQIDITKNFSISMSVNLGTKPQSQSGGDGLAIGLYNDTPGKVGFGGNGFGIGGLNQAFGFKLDTVYNNAGNSDVAADPIEFEDLLHKDGAFAGFIKNESNTLTTIDGLSQEISAPDGKYRELTFSYDANTKNISVNYDGKFWSYNVGTTFSSDHISLIISAGTGNFNNQHSVIVHSLDATLDSEPVMVKYMDENQTSIAPDKMLIDTLNAPYDVTSNEYKIPITGYVLDDTKLPNNATGTFTNSEQTVTYIYKVDQSTINVKDSTIYTGDKWKPQDNFVSATDVDGNKVDFSQLTVDDSKVDTSKAGVYDVTYTYDGVSSVAKITVKDKQTAVNVHDSSLYVGDTWKSEDNFDSATDVDGNKVDFSQLTVDDSKVDTSKAGVYDVTYTYDGVSSVAKITVKDKQTAVNVHDSSVYVGDTWKSEDNFDSAFDKDGNKVDFSQLTVDDSKVDTSKAGVYDVTYTYDGVSSVAKITVKDKQTAVNVHDSSVYVGDTWKSEDNFDSALDKDGNKVDFSQLTVDDSKVDTSKAGVYDVTYTYDGVSSVAKVTIKNKMDKGNEFSNENDDQKLSINKSNKNELPETGAEKVPIGITLFGVLSIILSLGIFLGRYKIKNKR
jgi:LPXTG-motif cell wall-anchored protein